MRKPKRPCNQPGCRNLTRDRYCHEHQAKAKEQNRFYDKYKRDQNLVAFYKSKEWELAREDALRRDKGLCQHCLKNKKITMADMVDHIIPVRVDWSLRLVLKNLQSLCNGCHGTKTAEDKKKYGKVRGVSQNFR